MPARYQQAGHASFRGHEYNSEAKSETHDPVKSCVVVPAAVHQIRTLVLGVTSTRGERYHAATTRQLRGIRSTLHLCPDPSRGERLAVVGLHVDAAPSNDRPWCIRRLDAVTRFAPHGMLSASRGGAKEFANKKKASVGLPEPSLSQGSAHPPHRRKNDDTFGQRCIPLYSELYGMQYSQQEKMWETSLCTCLEESTA